MGHVYGSDCWAGTSTGQKADGDHVHIWTALTERPCLGQMQYIRKFLLSEGNTYKDLKIAGDALSPQFSPAWLSDNLDGEAHMLLTSDKRIAFIYFENKCNQATVNNLQPSKTYKAQWFNPRTGAWTSAGTLTTDGSGKVKLPKFPGGKTQTLNNEDWAIKLKL